MKHLGTGFVFNVRYFWEGINYSPAVRQSKFYLPQQPPAAMEPCGLRHPPNCWNPRGVGCWSIRQSRRAPAVFLSQIPALSIEVGNLKNSRNSPAAIDDAAICDNFFIFLLQIAASSIAAGAKFLKTKHRGKGTIIPSWYF